MSGHLENKVPEESKDVVPYIDRRQMKHAIRTTEIPFTGATGGASVNIPNIRPNMIEVFGNLLKAEIVRTGATTWTTIGGSQGTSSAADDTAGGVDLTIPATDCADGVRGMIRISWTGDELP